MLTQQKIDQFFSAQPIAIAGVSRDAKKFGRQVYTDLKKKGMDVLPINPNIEEIDGEKCYASVNDLPKNVKALLVITPSSQTEEVVKAGIEKGIRNLWLQQMSDTPESIEIAEQAGVNLIHGTCIYLHAKPVKSFHSIHRFFMKVFNKLPK